MVSSSLGFAGRGARLARVLVCLAPLSVACARALDAPEMSDGELDAGTLAGASNNAGSGAEGGNPSAGFVSSSGATSVAGQAQAGADSSSSAGSGGQPEVAGTAGRAAGGRSAGGAAGASGAGGSVAAGGSTGRHICKITADINVYSPAKAGCGGYADCKGQLHWHNNESHALSQLVLSFQEPSGVTCSHDNAASKWTITDNGAASQRCVFSAVAGALSVDAMSALSFGYDTNQTQPTAPTDITVSDPSCN
jgi:hypothetical protein